MTDPWAGREKPHKREIAALVACLAVGCLALIVWLVCYQYGFAFTVALLIAAGVLVLLVGGVAWLIDAGAA